MGAFRSRCAVAIAALVSCAPSAFAQVAPPSASQVTPKSLAPKQETAPPELALPETTPGQVPANADKIHVKVGSVEVEGGFPDLAAETASLTASYHDRTASIAELYVLGSAVEHAYAAAGYIFVRVVVPPQSLKDGGTFRLRVVDGFIESIDLSKVPERARGPVGTLLQPLVGRTHTKLEDVERALTLAAAAPGVTLRSTIAPGKKTGAVILIIEATQDLYSAAITVDDRLGPAFADWELTMQASLNSALGMGEQFYGYLSGEPNLLKAFDANARRRVAGGGVTFPIGDDGLTATLEGTISDTKPSTPFLLLEQNGLFTRYVGRLAYPILKSRSETLSVTGSFAYAREVEVSPFFFNALLDEDRLNVARVAFDWNRSFDFWNANSDAYFEISKGLSWFDVRTLGEAQATGIGLSRGGASPNFLKLYGTLNYSQQLPYGFGLRLTAQGQLAPTDAMPSSEVFTLDGQNGLSMMTAGAVSADSGWSARGEVGYSAGPPLAGLPVGVVPYVFGAIGHASYKQFRFGETSHVAGYGAGFRIQSDVTRFLSPSLSVEAGHDDYLHGENRVIVTLGVHL